MTKIFLDIFLISKVYPRGDAGVSLLHGVVLGVNLTFEKLS